jgi:hypothetical protein
LEKFGITVIKPSNAFASKVDRFQHQQKPTKAQVPGPGQYNPKSEWVKVKSLGTKSEWKNVAFNKISNPPSIPSHDFVFGYEEDPKGHLVRQKNTEQVHTGVGKDKVGPGSY